MFKICYIKKDKIENVYVFNNNKKELKQVEKTKGQYAYFIDEHTKIYEEINKIRAQK